MDNLLFYTLLALLLWYFFYFVPNQKKPSRPDPRPSTSTSTQTDPVKTPGSYPFSQQDQTEFEQTLDFLIKEMKDLEKSL